MKEWPINPRFISLKDSVSEELAEINNEGMFYPDYIRGFLGDSSLDVSISNPLTLFQFVPKDFVATNFNNAIKTIAPNWIDKYLEKKYLGDRKLIRIDTDNLCHNRECCDCYRDQGDEQREFCQRQDSRVLLLAGESLDKYNIEKNFPEYYKKLERIIKEYNENYIKDDHFYIKLDTYEQGRFNRIYLSYICSESHLKEFLFPIYSCGKIIACMIQGQIIYKELDKKIMFKKYRDFHHCLALEETINKIEIEPQTNWEEKNKNRIDAIFKRINFLEQRINARVKIRTINYISQCFASIRNDFSTNFSTLSLYDEDLFDKFRQILNSTLNTVCTKFDVNHGFIRIFAIPFQIQSDHFKLIGASENISTSESQKYYFKINEEDRKQIIGLSQEYNKLLDKSSCEALLKTASPSIREEYQDNDIFRVVATISTKVYFIIWKRYPDWDAQSWYDDYKEGLFSLYNLIFQSYSFARGAFSEKMLENSIRISNHEAAQIVPAIASSIKIDFINKSAGALANDITSGIFYKKMENFYTQLYLLDGIYQRPSFIFKDVKITPKWIDLFDVLKKMSSLFSLQCRYSHMKIYCDPQKIENKDIFVERKLFDHILYNLMENAVKYGHNGTNIHLRAFTNNKDEFQIQIISYGPQISNKDKIYDLFVRGSSENVKKVEGMGIGMFISKKLCKIQGCDLTHSSTHLFQSHLPAIYRLKKMEKINFQIPNNALKFLSILNDMSINDIEETVNINSSFDFGIHKLNAIIGMTTYRNCFTIKLPISNTRPHISNQY